MTTLRREQSKVYFTESTRESLFREAFGLPDSEFPLSEVHSVLILDGKDEAYAGTVYLTDSYITFASADRKSCRLSLPLATIRRVEKLAPGQEGLTAGAFALALTLFHGFRIILQLNSMRQSCDNFCALLRTRLKASLPLMKSLKPFAKTFYSEDIMLYGEEKAEAVEKEPVLIEVEQKSGEEMMEWTTGEGTGKGYHGGLGLVFKFPGDPRKLREKSKMKLWKEYMKVHGRNLTMIKYPAFTRLVQVGLPNRLRGEVWESSCGSLQLRLKNPGVYAQILKDNEGKTSASTDDIEKDLHRSLPEYAAYQDPRGIDTMRRVLTAYAFSNPAVGYCQAMNLVVASFLIFMSEEQCFWCLSMLCERLLPGYYSPSMYGTVLDQRVFEHLVSRYLPSLSEHFASADIQLSIASLPWFLSCYISAMPMIFAFRIIDNLFLNGPKVLFQIGLAILRINGPALLESTDDGMFINTIKAYFLTLGDPAHPKSSDARIRAITRFQELLVVAFREFDSITDETIASERKRHRKAVVVSIETFAKRSTLRNLKFGRLSKDQMGKIYDHYQLASLKGRDSLSASTNSLPAAAVTKEKETETTTESRIDRNAFSQFIGGIAAWARDEVTVKNGFHEHIERSFVSHHLIDRLYSAWNFSGGNGLSLQDVVRGLEGILFNDLMAMIEWMFDLHDEDKDGFLTKDEVLALSESLLFIFRNERGDRYLGAVSNMLHNAFEYAESVNSSDTTEKADPDDDGKPYLNLATFRMVVLAEELLESFFDEDFRLSWKLEILIAEEKPKAPGAAGWFDDLLGAIVTDENKERLNRIADVAGRSLRIQTVEQQPSLGKLTSETSVLDPTLRGSLLSRNPPPASTTPATPATIAMPPAKAIPPPVKNPWATDSLPSRAIDTDDIDVEAAAARTLSERPQFTIDEAGAEEEGDYDFGDEPDDADLGGIVDEVDRLLIEDENATSAAKVAGAAEK